MSDQIDCDGIFDARLIRENRSAKGIFVTFEIAEDDYYAAGFSDVRSNSLLRIGYHVLTDVSVQPLESPVAQRTEHEVPDLKVAGSTPVGAAKPKKRFEDYPLSQQCGIRCDDESFREFMVDRSGILDEDVPAHVRGWCGVGSRAELATNPDAARLWRELNAEFEAWQMDQKYAETRR